MKFGELLTAAVANHHKCTTSGHQKVHHLPQSMFFKSSGQRVDIGCFEQHWLLQSVRSRWCTFKWPLTLPPCPQQKRRSSSGELTSPLGHRTMPTSCPMPYVIYRQSARGGWSHLLFDRFEKWVGSCVLDLMCNFVRCNGHQPFHAHMHFNKQIDAAFPIQHFSVFRRREWKRPVF